MTKKGANVVFISDSCHSGTVGKGVKNNAKFRFTPPENALGVKDLSELKLQVPKNQVKVTSLNLNGRYITLAAAKDNDEVFEGSNGAKVFIDPRSLKLLDGTVLDFDESNLLATSFTLKNPHAKSTCGCGESFSA